MAEAVLPPASLRVSISPPPSRSRKHQATQSRLRTNANGQEEDGSSVPTLADIEAGKARITDHLSHFSTKLSQHVTNSSTPRLSIPTFINLYQRNCHPHGHHFVVHQHDHPVAGPHYDLRLQISDTSSVSWAVMYGLPGNPNSRRLNRNATETRVHCLWVGKLPFRGLKQGTVGSGWRRGSAMVSQDEVADNWPTTESPH